MRVAIQGERGSNSHLATLRLLEKADLLPCAISAEVFEKLAVTHEADAAVLPVENSLHGTVADHSDLLLEHGVTIIAELSLRIRHALIAPAGVELNQVRQVLSHPVALSQCRRFFAGAPQFKAIPFYDTAGAVKHLTETTSSDAAAIAAPFAADIYRAHILQRDLEDDPQNFTRFVLLVRHDGAATLRVTRAQPDKMSLAFGLEHRPGALHKALGLLAAAGADLTRIESRPVPGKPWEYIFFVDLRFTAPHAVDAALKRLRTVCGFVTELGRYKAVTNQQDERLESDMLL